MSRANLVVLWHMHQPQYRDPETGRYVLPWTRLHALKDYWGMVEVLREFPNFHATFNVVPSLGIQLEEYASGTFNEPWFALISYQSGHGDSPGDLEWLTSGPASKNWKGSRTLPIINLEPNYEGHLAYQSRKPFDAHAVRRAAYWSLLVTPTAGVAYGAHGVWSWQTTPGVPMNHETTGIAPAWYDAIHFPGSTDMKYLRNFFESLKWWTLRPAQELLANQPGNREAAEFVAAAQSEEEPWVVLYFPVGQKIHLNAEKFPQFAIVRWYDPSRGQWKDGEQALGNSGELTAPDGGDWIAWIGAAASGQHSGSKL